MTTYFNPLVHPEIHGIATAIHANLAVAHDPVSNDYVAYIVNAARTGVERVLILQSEVTAKHWVQISNQMRTIVTNAGYTPGNIS